MNLTAICESATIGANLTTIYGRRCETQSLTTMPRLNKDLVTKIDQVEGLWVRGSGLKVLCWVWGFRVLRVGLKMFLSGVHEYGVSS